ncbi:MAG: glycosyltransferase family 2 protein, partial [Microcystis sp.]
MNQDKTAPKVTLVVVPRERFSFTMTSLENIYEMTDIPFKLVYVDGGSPAPIRDYLKKQSQEKGFELIRTEHYLIPNVARNMGLQWVTTPYVVFVDNDV